MCILDTKLYYDLREDINSKSYETLLPKTWTACELHLPEMRDKQYEMKKMSSITVAAINSSYEKIGNLSKIVFRTCNRTIYQWGQNNKVIGTLYSMRQWITQLYQRFMRLI